MPLVIGNTPLSGRSSHDYLLLQNDPLLQQSASMLLCQDTKEFGPEKLLYVHQREYAVVKPDDDHVDILGSDDATTCHLVILRHSGSGVTGVAHCDGSGMTTGIHDMLKHIKQLCLGAPEGRFELHLAGGFIDDRGISEQLTVDLLDVFASLPDEIFLLTACVTAVNDVMKNGVHFPNIYGLAVEIKTGKICKAVFPDKGPDISLRSATHFVGSDEMLNVYDNETHLLTIKPVDWPSTLDLEAWLQLPDTLLRKHLSSSPEQEPAHFAAHVRSTLELLENHRFPSVSLFPNSKPRCYTKQCNGNWTRIS